MLEIIPIVLLSTFLLIAIAYTKYLENDRDELEAECRRLMIRNAALRLELSKPKENENQICKFGGYVEVTEEINNA